MWRRNESEDMDEMVRGFQRLGSYSWNCAEHPDRTGSSPCGTWGWNRDRESRHAQQRWLLCLHSTDLSGTDLAVKFDEKSEKGEYYTNYSRLMLSWDGCSKSEHLFSVRWTMAGLGRNLDFYCILLQWRMFRNEEIESCAWQHRHGHLLHCSQLYSQW